MSIDRRLLRRAVLISWLAAGLSGCGDADHEMITARRVVAIDKVPADAMKGARAALPDTDFTESWQNIDREGKVHSYEIRGKTKAGKTREARVTAEGKLLETE